MLQLVGPRLSDMLQLVGARLSDMLQLVGTEIGDTHPVIRRKPQLVGFSEGKRQAEAYRTFSAGARDCRTGFLPGSSSLATTSRALAPARS